MTEFIAPSKHNPWAGGVANGFTAAQNIKSDVMLAATEAARERLGFPESTLVRITLEPKIGDNGMPRQASILCPVIGARKDKTKLRVIAPDGSDQWVAWK